MTSFTEVFGGSAIQPSQVSYASYNTAVSLVLSWPFEKLPSDNVAAGITDVLTSAASLSVTLPDASLVSVGAGVLFRNVGANTFTVLDSSGDLVATLASGQAWFVWVTDNSTPAGLWSAIQFGTGTSSASAASLAGAGLQAVVTLLNQNLVINSQISDYSLRQADRATVVRNTGGAVTYTPAVAGSGSGQLPNGWFAYIINSGSGSLSFTPQSPQTIDGESVKILAPSESAVFFSDGSNFWTLGYGRSIVSTVTASNIALPTSGPITLASTQAAAQVQNFTGTLTGNVTVNYGTGAGFWFVWNNTSGAFQVTFAVNGADPGVVVPQGSFSIIRSDGSNMHIAFTSTTGTVTSVATTSELTGGPITTTGTLDLSDTGVTPGTYGDATHSLSITVTNKGRISAVATNALGTAASATVGTAVGDLPAVQSDGNLPSLVGALPTGAVVDYAALTAPAGYILAFGTIGNGSSAATNRANADTSALFTLLWNNWADAQAPVSGGRGATAAADFAANKTIAVPDLRGRVVAGLDNMGGSAAGRLTSATMSPDGITIGATGGSQQITPTISVSGSTSGALGVSTSVSVSTTVGGGAPNTAPGGQFGYASAGVYAGSGSGSGSTSGSLTVSGTATPTLTVVQPSLLMSKIIKL